ncbi:MAG: fatty acid desaturase, partial [Pseudomonadota bacterium]
MIETSEPATTATPARDWVKILAKYREPSLRRSLIEIVVTVVPLVALWLIAWWALSVSVWLTLALAIPLGGMLTRLFLIQHDCGHGTFFRRSAANDWVGRVLGIFTMTPYDVWRRSHATHHATTGHLDKRGIGDITTLTVKEYDALPWWARLRYRIYRNPLVLFVIGPAYIFLIQHRLPLGFTQTSWRYWVSCMVTNLAIVALIGVQIYLLGIEPVLLIQLPMVVFAASIGVWLFYVQHQFEDTIWAADEEWDFHEAALYGSSHYVLPAPLRWITANIGMHHVHH